MERLLVVGSSGLLGNRLMELAKDKFTVFGTYNSHPLKSGNTYRLDVCDRSRVSQLMEKLKPDCVIDTHSLTNLDYSETHTEETWKINVEGSKNIAEMCKKSSCKYIFISTDYVFDGLKLRYTEKDKPHPLNYYAKTKLVMEYVLSTLDMNYMIARTAVLYGIGGSGKVSFPTWILDKLKKKEKVNALTDQKNNPTFVDSLCEFLFRLYQKDEVGTFHITGNECISRYDFAKKVAETFELDEGLIAPLTSPELNQIAPRPASVNMISEKAERAASIRTLSVDEGLELFKRQLAI